MRITRIVKDESGIALPVALAVLFVTAGLAVVAVRSGITANNVSFRDSNAKRASQAALSGLEAARNQANLMQPTNSQCTVRSSGQLANVTGTGGWCPAQTETLGDGASYSVLTSTATDVVPSVNGQDMVERTVVSTGIVNGIRRRAVMTFTATKTIPPLPTGYAIVSGKKLQMSGNSTVTGGLGSNGDIEFKGDNNTVCGPPPITYGRNGKYKYKAGHTPDTCGYTPTKATQDFAMPPVDLSGPKASNDNVRIGNAISNGTAGTSLTPTDSCSHCDKITWNPTTRELTIEKDGVLTLSGSTYLICKLIVKTGGTLQIGARTTPLYMYLDSQDNCKHGSEAQINGRIINLNSSAATFVLMAAGKPSHPTHTHGKITIGKDAITSTSAPMAIYAPLSKVEIKDNFDFKGTIVGREVKIAKDVNITYDPGLANLPSSGSRLYDSIDGSYKECTDVATTTTPSSGC